ncbi:hypothetical protein DS745_03520 [Anaerobacillus alkaliphilus]|uniref:Uncharacterized protein n=2 Tax=Anaerobacillus alkaliphilus TaxID=1548597 RepID=A0A4Q0VZB5_9BACI|nr:hypothetical protein DS745_03520 [Anaerobacillus alkaliphilus]
MYNQKESVAEHRLNNLYASFEFGLGTYYANLTNAKEGRGKEHLLLMYADLHSTSVSNLPLMAALGLPHEEVKDILDFYKSRTKEWLLTDIVLSDEEYNTMISDLALIRNTLTRYEGEWFKERPLTDWTTEEYHNNIHELVKKLNLYGK